MSIKKKHLLEFYQEKQEGLGIKIENILEFYRGGPMTHSMILNEIRNKNNNRYP